jgi:hypothetical protein
MDIVGSVAVAGNTICLISQKDWIEQHINAEDCGK